ncbi:hypothetical protein C5167_032953 [Papaver somniferum]|uniref:Uncharacterized protein n=1 Tax=Papaver somniferum TaxID=3469 RepID=A0A4Y7K8Y4_PAPSO|nr:hypothetical protein C5167_032953 [Papaver somniferum]
MNKKEERELIHVILNANESNRPEVTTVPKFLGPSPVVFMLGVFSDAYQ